MRELLLILLLLTACSKKDKTSYVYVDKSVDKSADIFNGEYPDDKNEKCTAGNSDFLKLTTDEKDKVSFNTNCTVGYVLPNVKKDYIDLTPLNENFDYDAFAKKCAEGKGEHLDAQYSIQLTVNYEKDLINRLHKMFPQTFFLPMPMSLEVQYKARAVSTTKEWNSFSFSRLSIENISESSELLSGDQRIVRLYANPVIILRGIMDIETSCKMFDKKSDFTAIKFANQISHLLPLYFYQVNVVNSGGEPMRLRRGF
jgi:hypothetical protein